MARTQREINLSTEQGSQEAAPATVDQDPTESSSQLDSKDRFLTRHRRAAAVVLAITGLVTAVGVAVGFGSASSGSREVAPRPVASGKKGKATPIITTQPTNPEAINPSDGLPGDLQYLTSDSPTELADQYATNLQGYYNTGNASYLEFS